MNTNDIIHCTISYRKVSDIIYSSTIFYQKVNDIIHSTISY